MTGETDAIITLRIYGDSLVPEALTALMLVEPSRSHPKGFRPRGSGGQEYAPRKTGMWLLKAPQSEEPFDLRVLSLLERLPTSPSVWEQLQREFALELVVGYFMKQSNEEMQFTLKVLRALSDRGISLGLDIYDPVDETDTITDYEESDKPA